MAERLVLKYKEEKNKTSITWMMNQYTIIKKRYVFFPLFYLRSVVFVFFTNMTFVQGNIDCGE